MTGIAIAIALPLSAIAGLMAFVITYDEMERHLGHRRAVLEATRAGVTSFCFFVVLSLAIVFALRGVIQ